MENDLSPDLRALSPCLEFGLAASRNHLGYSIDYAGNRVGSHGGKFRRSGLAYAKSRLLFRGICGATASCHAVLADDSLSELEIRARLYGDRRRRSRMMPKFEGSDRYEFIPVPSFDIRPKGTPARFTAPRDGFGVTVYETGQFNFGPVAASGVCAQGQVGSGIDGLGDVKMGGRGSAVLPNTGRSIGCGPACELRKGFNGHHGVDSGSGRRRDRSARYHVDAIGRAAHARFRRLRQQPLLRYHA